MGNFRSCFVFAQEPAWERLPTRCAVGQSWLGYKHTRAPLWFLACHDADDEDDDVPFHQFPSGPGPEASCPLHLGCMVNLLKVMENIEDVAIGMELGLQLQRATGLPVLFFCADDEERNVGMLFQDGKLVDLRAENDRGRVALVNGEPQLLPLDSQSLHYASAALAVWPKEWPSGESSFGLGTRDVFANFETDFEDCYRYDDSLAIATMRTLMRSIAADHRDFTREVTEDTEYAWPTAVWRQVVDGRILFLPFDPPELEQPYFGAFLFPVWPQPGTPASVMGRPQPPPKGVLLLRTLSGPLLCEMDPATLLLAPRGTVDSASEPEFLEACRAIFYEWQHKYETEDNPKLLARFLQAGPGNPLCLTVAQAAALATQWVSNQQEAICPILWAACSFGWLTSKRKPESFPYFRNLVVSTFLQHLGARYPERQAEIRIASKEAPSQDVGAQAHLLLSHLGRKTEPKAADAIAQLLQELESKLSGLVDGLVLRDGQYQVDMAKREVLSRRRPKAHR
jgi:hypothetical protein